jgi:CBS-domain-containing membrane protein
MRGLPAPNRQRPRTWILARTWIAVVIAVAVLALPNYYFNWSWATNLFIVTSFGSTIVLLIGAPRAEFSQPRNALGGHVIAAICGVTAFKLIGQHQIVAIALGLATAIIVMQVLHAVHPPAGATAIFAVIGGTEVTNLGYWYVLIPTLVGVAILVAVAVVVNNAFSTSTHHYPVHWL